MSCEHYNPGVGYGLDYDRRVQEMLKPTTEDQIHERCKSRGYRATEISATVPVA